MPSGLRGPLRPLGHVLDRAGLERKVWRDRLSRIRPRQHGLPGELIVSLTSYPPRFPTLHRTLHCLLRQTVRPDRIVLWIGETEELPQATRKLEAHGLEIRCTRHLGAFTKLVPALAVFPQAFIATADDDAYYPPDWLECLSASYDEDSPAILCRRAHRPAFEPDGSFLPFDSWQTDVRDAAARRPSADLIPTGVGGVLYPPRSLDPTVADETLFTRLCPHTDDFWFYWMARRAGSLYRLVGPGFDYLDWPGSQVANLHAENLRGRYDREIAALVAHFGLPGPVAAKPPPH